MVPVLGPSVKKLEPKVGLAGHDIYFSPTLQ